VRLWRHRFTRFCAPFEIGLSTSIRLRLLPVVTGVSQSGKNLTNPYIRLTVKFRNSTDGSLPSMAKIRAWPARMASLDIHQTSRIDMGTALVGSTHDPPSVVNGGHPCRAREGSGLVRSGIRFPWLQLLPRRKHVGQWVVPSELMDLFVISNFHPSSPLTFARCHSSTHAEVKRPTRKHW